MRRLVVFIRTRRMRRIGTTCRWLWPIFEKHVVETSLFHDQCTNTRRRIVVKGPLKPLIAKLLSLPASRRANKHRDARALDSRICQLTDRRRSSVWTTRSSPEIALNVAFVLRPSYVVRLHNTIMRGSATPTPTSILRLPFGPVWNLRKHSHWIH